MCRHEHLDGVDGTISAEGTNHFENTWLYLDKVIDGKRFAIAFRPVEVKVYDEDYNLLETFINDAPKMWQVLESWPIELD